MDGMDGWMDGRTDGYPAIIFVILFSVRFKVYRDDITLEMDRERRAMIPILLSLFFVLYIWLNGVSCAVICCAVLV